VTGRRIAVAGSGVAGLTAAYLLSRGKGRYLRMLTEVRGFHRAAWELLADGGSAGSPGSGRHGGGTVGAGRLWLATCPG
jgi:glycine/D-amino acid oxidase-like deaminating enzyme